MECLGRQDQAHRQEKAGRSQRTLGDSALDIVGGQLRWERGLLHLCFLRSNRSRVWKLVFGREVPGVGLPSRLSPSVCKGRGGGHGEGNEGVAGSDLDTSLRPWRTEEKP